MATPTAFEQELLELINLIRADPSGEFGRLIVNQSAGTAVDPDITSAISYYNVDLGLFKSQMSAFGAVAPLAWNTKLASAANGHSQQMISQDYQDHVLPGEANVGARITSAGYTWNAYGENIYAFAKSPIQAHAGFVIDWGSGTGGMQTPPGHRNTILSDTYTEVGISALVESNSSTSVGPYVITQDFGRQSGYAAQLLGSVFTDADGDAFYDAGEGLGGVTVSVSGTSGTFSTQTWSAGGYQLVVPAGSYTITFSGGGLSAPITKSATISTKNVHVNAINGSGGTGTGTDLPDLTADDIKISDTTLAAGDSATVTFDIHNIGTGNAGASNVGIYLSTNDVISTSDTLLTTKALGTLSAGYYFNDTSATITLPSWVAAGTTYYIGVVADYDGTVSETDGANNASEAVAITTGGTQRPDLTADDVKLSSTTIAAGDTVTMTFDLHNIGDIAADASNVGIYLSTNDVISTSDTLLTTKSFSGLDAGYYFNDASVSVVIPGWVAPGSTYYLGVVADYDEMVGESSGTNNASEAVAITTTDPYGGAIRFGTTGWDILSGGPSGESLYGFEGNDTIEGNGGDDYISGGDGNDNMSGGTGTNTLDGGPGLDTAYYFDSVGNAFISRSGTIVTITLGTTDTLVDVERVHFSDGTVAFDLDGNAGQVYRLYQAAFGRTPDTVGLASNIGLVDNGMSLHDMANAFAGSPEFQNLFGAHSTNAQYVNALYNNVLGRDAEPAGLAGWLDALATGSDRGHVLTGFSESKENIELVAPAIDDGIWLG